MKNNMIFKMVYCSIMAAMAYVCTLFEIPLSFTVTLYGIPLIFVGIMFGPIYGVLTGLIAGFLEQMKYGISLQTFLCTHHTIESDENSQLCQVYYQSFLINQHLFYSA